MKSVLKPLSYTILKPMNLEMKFICTDQAHRVVSILSFYILKGKKKEH